MARFVAYGHAGIDAALKAAGARYYDWGGRGLRDADKPKADEVATPEAPKPEAH